MRRRLPVFRILLGLLLVLALLTAGLYLMIVRQIDEEMTRLAARVSPIGTLEWGEIRIQPDGQVRINDLGFAPHLVAGEIRIQHLALAADNLMALALATRDLAGGRLPPALGLRMRGLDVPIAGSGYERLEVPFASGLPFEAAGCAGREWLMVGDLPELDIWNLVSDVGIDYRLAGQGEQVRLKATSQTRQLAAVSLDARLHLGGESRDVDRMAAVASMARLEQLELEYRDLGLRDRLEAFCADQLDQSVETFRRDHLEAWARAWARHGLSPGRALHAAYAVFIEQPHSIMVHAQPRRALPVSSFTRLEAGELLARLEPTLRVNDGEAVPVHLEQVPVRSSQVDPWRDDGVRAEDDQPATTRRLAWTTIDAVRVEARLGERVRLTMQDGNRIAGELVEVDADHLHLRIRGTGGYFVRPFNRQQLTRIEVREAR